MDVDFNPLFTIICFIINLILSIVLPIIVLIIVIVNFIIFALNGVLLLVCKALFLVTKIVTGISTQGGEKKGARRCAGCIGDPYCRGSSPRIYLDKDICEAQVTASEDDDDPQDPDSWESERCDCDDCKPKKIGCDCNEVIPYLRYMVLTCGDQCYAPYAIKPSEDL